MIDHFHDYGRSPPPSYVIARIALLSVAIDVQLIHGLCRHSSVVRSPAKQDSRVVISGKRACQVNLFRTLVSAHLYIRTYLGNSIIYSGCF